MYAIVLYRDHAMDPARPKWATLRGTRFVGAKTLADAGIKRDWYSFLNIMIASVHSNHEGEHIVMDKTEAEAKAEAKQKKLAREKKKLEAARR